MRLFISFSVLLVAVRMANAEPLRIQDREFLEERKGQTVVASVRYKAITNEITSLRNAKPHIRLDDISTFIVRTSAETLLKAADWEPTERIEIIDDDVANRVSSLLTALQRTSRFGNNIYSFGVLNISLGVPPVKYGTNRTADETVRRAIEHLIKERNIPVVMSIGNDGPTPGLVNPWALADGVFMATATDSAGGELWTGASRFRKGEAKGRRIFAAHGYLSSGPWAAGSPKTPAMIEAEKKANLANIVGAGNEHLYRVDSGTSYAAAIVTKSLCLIHQATHLLRLQMNAAAPLGGVLPPFIRAYADTGIDSNHPAFANRIVGASKVYGGLSMEFEATRRKALLLLVERGVEFNVRYDAETASELLRRSALPVPNTSFEDAGYGFISNTTVAKALSALNLSDLVQIYGDMTDERMNDWVALASQNNSVAFLPQEISAIANYCSDYDLIFMSKVN